MTIMNENTSFRAGELFIYPDGDVRTLLRPAPDWGPGAWHTVEGKIVNPSEILRIGGQRVAPGCCGA